MNLPPKYILSTERMNYDSPANSLKIYYVKSAEKAGAAFGGLWAVTFSPNRDRALCFDSIMEAKKIPQRFGPFSIIEVEN